MEKEKNIFGANFNAFEQQLHCCKKYFLAQSLSLSLSYSAKLKSQFIYALYQHILAKEEGKVFYVSAENWRQLRWKRFNLYFFENAFQGRSLKDI